jgi:hypothetical protein
VSELHVGYYVHHHGIGHLTRYRAISDAAPFAVHPVSELTDVAHDDGGCVLPSDVLTADAAPDDGARLDPTADGTLHWAPLAAGTAAPRLAAMTAWLDELRPAGVVIDVSVEAALTCRLAGFATVVVRQHGRRDDAAHTLAYRQAARLLAPWPAELEDPATPDWVLERTEHVGFVGPSSSTPTTTTPVCVQFPVDHPTGIRAQTERSAPIVGVPGPSDVVVLWGRGGGSLPPAALVALAGSTGDATIYLAGCPVGRHTVDAMAAAGGNVQRLGWVERPAELLTAGAAVVASGGNNVVAVAAHHGCPLVVVPQPRPFDEQLAHARRLDAVGAAVCVEDPVGADWPRAIGLARARAATLAALAVPGGAGRAATVIADAFGGAAR